MTIIHFSHANGFPSKTYSILFDFLKEYHVTSIDVLGANKKPEEIDWVNLSEEIIESVKELNRPVVGVGHSLGGILTLLAAAKEPKMFESVILLDPPIFSPLKRFIINILRVIKIEDVFSPAGKSKKRREKFKSKEQAYEYFKSKILFKSFHSNALEDYIKHGLVQIGNELKLKIPVEKEIAIYRKLLIKYPNSVYNVNGLIIHGATNPIHWNSDIRWFKKKFVNIDIYPFPGSHFFPLENPQSTAMLIKSFLKNN